ncbi:ATP-binding protein [Agathobaculum sp. NTUH-O15-33]|uniref:ATP-binding protein n=1 Tax=Agathobaculum sp. NTUH-O15-33 TaxID=3079302 RepID=UPI002958C689|nr:ATP-binding protein [Agathobaculum sp. NTUH-O15-33]WNX85872.1 ATP-binding protein [Agathobaculum sp. NTUH-O15-33]
MKDRTKAGLSRLTLLICIVTLLFAIISVYTAGRMRDTAQNVYEHPYASSNSARGMRSRLLDMKRFVNIFLTYDFKGAQNTRALFQERYDMQIEAIHTLYEKYSGPKEDVDALQAAMDELIAKQDKAIDFAMDHTEDETAEYITRYVYPQYDLISDRLTTIIDFADQKICELTETSRRTAMLSMLVALLLSTGIIFLSVYSNCREQKDIETLKNREHALQDALLMAQKANSAKKDFLSCMSHELRTPLNVITGMTAIAGAHLDDRDRVEDCLSKVTFSSRHLLSIINDVLDMAKMEEGKLSINNEPFQLQQLLEPLADSFNAQAAELGLQFTCDNKADTGQTYIGDYRRIDQILLNLLSNAMKFTPKGGQVRLEVQQMPAQNGETWLRFIVSDTGIGIKEDFLEHIFIPFEQADSSTSRKYGGTGLGMAITHNLTSLMRGTIQVQSKPGEGSAFTVELPFKTVTEQECKADEPGAPTIPQCAGMRFLLAEDNLLNREIAVEILAATGAEIDGAENGKEALERLLAAPAGYYDLVFMDIQMPVMDGYEAVKRWRASAHPDAKTLPVIAMTANTLQEDVTNALAAGMNGHIAKPIDITVLFQIVTDNIK